MRRTFLLLAAVCAALGAERQLTHSPRNHALDNNDNFSASDRWICVDTRGSGQAIVKIDARTGEESDVYAAGPTVVAASFLPGSEDEVVFIHGPFDAPYAKTNRLGAVAGPKGLRFLDTRDVASNPTPPGAHRGGTHRHEPSLDGRRIAFTYDDHLLPVYGRTIGMLSAHAKAPNGRMWFNVLVRVVPEAAAKAGDLVMASGDSWVGEKGEMRAFIGRVKESDGGFTNALFAVDIPANVDVTTGSAGDAMHYPTPPRGVKVRRLTKGEVFGIVRGSRDGKWIAYLAEAAGEGRQVFVIPAKGGAPKQVTHAVGGITGGPRWLPDSHRLVAPSKEGILLVDAKAATVRKLTAAPGDALAVSNDGKSVAFNRRVNGYLQVFLVPVDADMSR